MNGIQGRVHNAGLSILHLGSRALARALSLGSTSSGPQGGPTGTDFGLRLSGTSRRKLQNPYR